MGETKQFVTKKPNTGKQASRYDQVGRYIGKVTIIDVRGDELHRREETIVRLVFSATRRKLRKQQRLTHFLNCSRNPNRD